jgi:succinate CoA transferase
MKKDDPQIVPAIDVPGVILSGFLEVGDRSLDLSLSAIQDPPVRADIGIFGLNGQNPRISIDGGFNSPQVEIQITQFDQSSEVFRVLFDEGLQAGNLFIQLLGDRFGGDFGRLADGGKTEAFFMENGNDHPYGDPDQKGDSHQQICMFFFHRQTQKFNGIKYYHKSVSIEEFSSGRKGLQLSKTSRFPIMSAEEAAAQIPHGATVAFSGFTPAGAAKRVPRSIADRAAELHRQGKPFQIRMLTGASCGESIDEALAKAKAIAWRAPYQTSRTLRQLINRQEVEYVDMHLSHVPQCVSFGFFGKIDFAVIEATEVTADGRVYLTTSIGASPTYLKEAEKVIIEINHYHSPRLREMADILIIPPPPHRNPIQIHEVLTKTGWPHAFVDPQKVIGIVENEEADHIGPFAPPNAVSQRIAEHIVQFFLQEMREGRIPKDFLPLQAGVGNITNGVMAALGNHPEIPPFQMYSEVFQDSLVELMERGKLLAASATSLTVTPDTLQRIYENMDFFARRIVLRPQELSNHPGVIRRLCVIALNTVLEVDVYGNSNSSHAFGTDVVNGIGGSADFTRNSYLSILMCPSISKGGKLSAVVPMCPHIDNAEHSVQIVVTEQGLADLRGMGPMQRAKTIIEKCAHPAYRPYLRQYVEKGRLGHIRHDLTRCFELHRNFLEFGHMLPHLPERVFAEA